MSEQGIKEAMNSAANEMQTKSHQAQAVIGDVADKVTTGVAKASDQASAAVTKLTDGAIDVYDQVYTGARKFGANVEPFIQDRPYTALALSATIGLFVGLLMSLRAPKVVYLRSSH